MVSHPPTVRTQLSRYGVTENSNVDEIITDKK